MLPDGLTLLGLGEWLSDSRHITASRNGHFWYGFFSNTLKQLTLSLAETYPELSLVKVEVRKEYPATLTVNEAKDVRQL